MELAMEGRLRSVQSLRGYVLHAKDGEIGRVKDFYFNDQNWVIRYLVVETGSWLLGRRVLISPISVLRVEPESSDIRVSLTREQVENSPSIESDRPVSRQREREYYDYLRWPYYWTGGGVWGIAPYPGGMLARPYGLKSPEDLEQERYEHQQEEVHEDPNLRSAREVVGYHIEARDARFGHVEDLLMDDRDWVIRYLVIDTKNWWPSKSVLVSPAWVSSLSWEDQKIRVDLQEREIKEAPEFNPEQPVNREFEERLYDYYGRPKYWVEPTHAPGLKDAIKKPGRYVLR